MSKFFTGSLAQPLNICSYYDDEGNHERLRRSRSAPNISRMVGVGVDCSVSSLSKLFPGIFRQLLTA